MQGNNQWSIFNERFDWLNSSNSYYDVSKITAVNPGDKIISNIHASGTGR